MKRVFALLLAAVLLLSLAPVASAENNAATVTQDTAFQPEFFDKPEAVDAAELTPQRLEPAAEGALLRSDAQAVSENATRGFDTQELEEPLLGAAALPASGTCGDGVSWAIDTAGTLTISGSGEMAFWDTDSSIPWYAYRSQVKAIYLAADVTKISDGAFRILTSVETVAADANNTHYRVVDNVLYDADQYYLVYYPAGRTDTQFTVPETVFFIRHSAFCGANKLTDVSLPNILYYIDNYAFKNCSQLQSIVFPKGLSTIGTDAFYGCSRLNDVHFSGDSALWSLVQKSTGNSRIASAVCDGEGAPAYSDAAGAAGYLRNALKNREPVVIISCGAEGDDLQNSILRLALAHTGVSNEGDALVDYQTYLLDSTAAPSGTLLRYYFIHRTTPAQELELEAAIDAMLASLDLDNKNDYEKIYAIYDAICKTVTYDNENLHNEAYQLKYTAYAAMINHTAVCNGYALLLYRMLLKAGIDCRYIGGKASETAVDGHAWNIVKLDDLYYNCDTTWDAGAATYRYFLRGSTAEEFAADHIPDPEYTTSEYDAYPMSETAYQPTKSGTCGDNLTWTLSGGVLHISGTGDMADFADETEVPWSADRTTIEQITIDEGITSISSYAFYYCSSVSSLTIPDSVTKMGGNVVFGCSSLEEIHIGKLLASLSTSTFAYCTSLQRFTVAPENTAFSTDSAGALLINGTQLLAYPAGRIGEYTIPDGTTLIYSNAFFYTTQMTTLNIPATVTEIQARAFRYVQNLNTVNYAGTEKQWAAVTIGDGNEALLNAELHCTEQEFVDSGECGNDLTWTLDAAGLLTISGTGDMFDYGVLDSPWCFDAKHVQTVVIESGATSIGTNALRGCTEIEQITLPDTLTRIGSYAMLGCTGLATIDLPDSVVAIENYAFQDCTGLTRFTVPANCTSMDASAVRGCSSITEFTVSEGNTAFTADDGVLFTASMTELVAYPCGRSGAYAIPSGVDRVGFLAFYNCTGLTAITIPKSVTSIGEWAFYNCTALQTLTLHDGITEIANGVFSDCSALTEVYLPATLTRFYPDAFASCSAIAHVYFGGTLAQWQSITNVGSGNEAIYNAIIHYTDVAVVTDSGKTGSITWQFYDDGTLKISGSGAITNGASADAFPWFKHSAQILNLEIAEGVTGVGQYAFYNYDALQTVSIPNSVTTIGQLAFSDCDALTEIEIGSGLTTIYTTSLAACSALQSISVSVQNESFVSPNGVLLTKNKKTLIAYPVGREGAYTIPDGVQTISAYAFCYAQSMPSITIPSSVTTVADHAFAYVNGLNEIHYTGAATQWAQISIGTDNDALQNAQTYYEISSVASGTCGDNLTWTLDSAGVLTVSGTGAMATFQNSDATPWHSHADAILFVVIENGVTSLTHWAFSYLPSLKEATIGSGLQLYYSTAFACSTALQKITVSPDNTNYHSVNGVLFRTAPQELLAYPPAKSGDYEIPEGTTAIGSHAFLYAGSLGTLTIPVSVASVGNQAFLASAMDNVIYCGTETQWNSITIGSDNDTLTNASREYRPAHTHTYTSTVTIQPTCTANGEMTYTCTCGDSYTEPIAALGHDLIHHDAKEATCTEIGWNAYDTCSRCDYSTYAEIAALGHNLIHHEAKEATCTEIGWSAYDTCSRCDYSTYAEIAALGHDLTHHEAKEATCTEIGWSAYDTCSRCDYSTYAEIAALGHDLIHHEAKEATCTEIGWNAYDTCSRCDYSTYAEIAAHGHEWSAEKVLITEPTAASPGLLAYTCAHCDALKDEEEIPPYILGDVNGDKVVNGKDVTVLRRYLVGGYGITVHFFASDVNRDKEVNAKDVTFLRRYFAGGYGLTLD